LGQFFSKKVEAKEIDQALTAAKAGIIGLRYFLKQVVKRF